MASEQQARIFLSSGQIDGSEEVDLVREVKNRLESAEFGFRVSVGTGTNATDPVAGNVFQRLRDAEYFILVDFARGSVSGEPTHSELFQRGSLFSEQELAVAVFRGLHYLVFEERGMLKRDGLLKHVSSDPVIFDRGTLVNTVCDRVLTEIREGRWDSKWRNELALSRLTEGPDTENWTPYGDGTRSAKWFHVEVENRHRDQLATGVHAYLEAWTDSQTPGDRKVPPLVELKFSGVRTQAVSIPPKQKRGFDGIFVFQHLPGHVQVGINTFLRDWTGLDQIYHFEGKGREIDLYFAVFCDQFEPARKRFRLKIGADGDSTKLIDPEVAAAQAADGKPKIAFRCASSDARSSGTSTSVTTPEYVGGTYSPKFVVDPGSGSD